jgi:hypothetical protein
MISAREPIGSRDDIWTRADKGYDMKNGMLCYVYHILQQWNFEQIYHVWEGYLQNIPVERRTISWADTPPNMIYLFNYTEYYLEHWFVVFRNIQFLLGFFQERFSLL